MNTLFFEQHDVTPPGALLALADDLFYFAKDCEGRYVYPNKWLQTCFELPSADSILGKTDFDFFDVAQAEHGRRDEQTIMQQGISIKNQLLLCEGANERLYWLFIDKSPLRDRLGRIIGIEGLCKDAEVIAKTLVPFQQFSSIIQHIQQHYAKDISIAELAQLSAMSITTFERHFQRHFHCSPKTYMTRLRIQDACRRLSAGQPIKRVAHDLGFCDQSHFTKTFKQVVGTPPGEYQQAPRRSHAVAELA